MPNKVLELDPQDNALIAMADLPKGEQIVFDSQTYTLESDIPAKHKFATEALAPGANVRMYGVLVGEVAERIRRGCLLTPKISIIKPHPFTKKPLTSAGRRPTSLAGASANFSDTAAPTDKSAPEIIGLSSPWSSAKTAISAR
jgi:hypothetical protein